MEFNESADRKVINVDIDNTLTNGEKFWETEPTPDKDIVSLVRELYKSGNIIIIHTARQWEYAPETVAWLIRNRVPYHGLYMAKGGADHYLDDKNVMAMHLRSLTRPHADNTESNQDSNVQDGAVWYRGERDGE